jgi:two-component system phosphate regulon sensor histidine kinase PhoR
MSWTAIFSRILLVVLPGVAIGWYFDQVLAGVSLALLAVLVFWLWQMQQLQRWLLDVSRPPPDLAGAWGEIVSRIYQSQQIARKERNRLQEMVDYLLDSFTSMRDGVVIVEDGGGIRWCNETAIRMLGLRHPEDIGRPVTSLVRQPAFTEYFNAGKFEEPLQFRTSGESSRHLQVIITHFAAGDRLLFVRDVTKLVKMEQTRRDFVGNVSHELRTPLTVITGYLDTILDDTANLPPAYRKPLQQMSQQAGRMESMLKDLLWLSRIESEELIAKREQVDMAGLLDELRDELGNVYPGREMKLEVESRYPVMGDYRELYSAVSNLVHNAFKYSADNTPVSVKWCQSGENYLLSVEDHGAGIDPAHFDRLTERFYRVDDSRSSSTGGTGLGLAIVKHVAVAHGARLEIESEPGKGSTFALRFPPVARAARA